MRRSVQIKEIGPDHHRTYLTSPIGSFERNICLSLSLYGNIYPLIDRYEYFFSYQEKQIRIEMFLSKNAPKHPLFNNVKKLQDWCFWVSLTHELGLQSFEYAKPW